MFSSAVMPSIGTHSGTFHCDEALGCYLLKLTDRYGAAAVTRSRDAAKLHGLDVVIDVGGVFDPGELCRRSVAEEASSLRMRLQFTVLFVLGCRKPAVRPSPARVC